MIRGSFGASVNHDYDGYSDEYDESDEEQEEERKKKQVDPVQYMALPYFAALSSC